MGLFATIGSAVGSLAGPVGTAVGGTIGGLMDGAGKKDSQMDDYTAYQIQKEKEWEAMYGPIEKNLVSHYEHLSATSHIAKGNAALEQQHKTTMDRVSQQLVARGLDVKGGVSTSIMADSLNMLGKQKAELQLTADDYIAKQQQQFYSQMRQGKPNAGSMVGANATMNYNQNAYDDKMLSAGIASGVDLGKKIFNSGVDTKLIDGPKIGGKV